MQTFLMILQLFPLVINVVKSIEETVTNEVPGTTKKKLFIDVIVATMGALSTNVNGKTMQVVSSLVDSTVTGLNAIGVFKKVSTPVEQPLKTTVLEVTKIA